MSKKFLPVLLVLTVASLFVAFQTQGRGGGDNPKTKNEKILRNVGMLLEQGHYSPKNINDSFSKQVLNRFVKDLDEDKSIFLQSDIDSFSKFENRIDDEIHGAKLESFYAINDSYTRRLNQASQYFTDLLSKPFDFTKDENVLLDGDKLSYPKTEADKKEAWRKRLKYMVLSKYSDMLDDREANKNKKPLFAADSAGALGKAAPKKFVYKADSTLEREARDMIRKQIDRYFTTLKTHNTNDELFSSFVNAITGEMDPHSNYFAPVDSRGFNEMMSGKFYGIGAQLKEEESKIKIASLITGMPAWKSGEIGVNDEVIKIGQGNAEPVDVTGYAVTDAVKLIRGSEAGTEVRLTVRKPDGSIKIVSLKRGEIKLEDTFAKSAIIKGEHKIGYIYLPEFYMDFEKPNGAKCSEDVAKEIVKLKAENVEGIVMDLRGNGGGSLPEVVKMAGLFIEDGPICQVRGRDEKQPYLWKDRDKSILYSGPLTVMVDEGSASASEIFAAAIQDYKRGIIIGSTSTYGKGTVQRTIPLNPEAENPAFAKNTEDLGTVKLTLQKFYRINGGATQLKGVTPDVVIPDRYEFFKSREKDNDAALNWDEINKADYHPWVSTYSSDAVINAAKDQVNTSSTFQSMKQQIEWIDKKNDKEVSLNLTKYKADLQQMKTAYKQLDSLYKLPKELTVLNNPADTTGLGTDKDRMDRNKQFLDRLKGDIYVDETVKVMNNMINQTNIAVNAASAESKKQN
ncbi:carboxy terminal-processing peptidase [Ferruginibacter paludis]|uniref:carboxy terminal-processing peptidase n=1 Tax=Ferruginibacter paludis TaxID=1310417 RepID=UPI0025B4D1F0|nr:carboxy terminal-processing peptidase [Ferruginibacter paludis]MDN3657117.1 carboxy terminal-processing peptidase [Ferruginibacter paludis]